MSINNWLFIEYSLIYSHLRISILELALFFELFLMALQILDHEVLPGEFVVVSEVIHSLMRLQMEVVKYVIDAVPLYPQQVPVLAKLYYNDQSCLPFNLPPATFLQGVHNTIPEGRLKLNVRAIYKLR